MAKWYTLVPKEKRYTILKEAKIDKKKHKFVTVAKWYTLVTKAKRYTILAEAKINKKESQRYTSL